MQVLAFPFGVCLILSGFMALSQWIHGSFSLSSQDELCIASQGRASSHYSPLFSQKGLTMQVDTVQIPSATNSKQSEWKGLGNKLAMQAILQDQHLNCLPNRGVKRFWKPTPHQAASQVKVPESDLP